MFDDWFVFDKINNQIRFGWSSLGATPYASQG